MISHGPDGARTESRSDMTDNQDKKLDKAGVEEADEAIEVADVDESVAGHLSARSDEPKKQAASKVARY